MYPAHTVVLISEDGERTVSSWNDWDRAFDAQIIESRKAPEGTRVELRSVTRSF